MAVSSSIMHFREERAVELERIAKLLEQIIGGDIYSSTSKIYTAARLLKDKSYTHSFKNVNAANTWGYSIEDFTLRIPKPRHAEPMDVKEIDIILSVNLIASCLEWENLNDPLCGLSFRVTIKGTGEKATYYSGFHIDKHDMNQPSDELHPIYHIQYVPNPDRVKNFDSGHFLYLDSPRIPHFPLDFILGIGFITSNFFPIAFNSLMDDGLFANLSRQYQERIWKPYAHTLANHWKPFQETNIIWTPCSHLYPTIL